MFRFSSHPPSCNACQDFWGSELLGSFSKTPSSLLPPWAHVASTVTCCFCSCWLWGWFLQESFSTPQPRGHLVSAGQDHSIERLLLWRCYLWDSLSPMGGLQKDFQVVPSFPILHLPVPSNWSCAPLSFFAMSQPRRHSKPGKVSMRQLPDKPAADFAHRPPWIREPGGAQQGMEQLEDGPGWSHLCREQGEEGDAHTGLAQVP